MISFSLGFEYFRAGDSQHTTSIRVNPRFIRCLTIFGLTHDFKCNYLASCI